MLKKIGRVLVAAKDLAAMVIVAGTLRTLSKRATEAWIEAIEHGIAERNRRQKARDASDLLDKMFKVAEPGSKHDERCISSEPGMAEACDCGFWSMMDGLGHTVVREKVEPEPEVRPQQSEVIDAEMGDVPHECGCGAAFRTEGALRVHLIDDHADEDD